MSGKSSSSASRLSDRYLIPALDQRLETFPFVILGFHSDNGSEYINRKYLRYGHIPSRFAQQVNDFAVKVPPPRHIGTIGTTKYRRSPLVDSPALDSAAAIDSPILLAKG
jgi:hypothetical protein